MSLYGLDVIVANDGRRFLNEINGICSGMRGFHKVYGDIQNKDIINWEYVSSKKMKEYNISSTDLAFVEKLNG